MSKVISMDRGDTTPPRDGSPYVDMASVTIGDPDSDGDLPIQATVSVTNPTTEDIDGLHVLLVARDERDMPVGTFQGDAGQVPASGQTTLNISGYLYKGTAEVHNIDLYPQVITVERVAVAADIMVEGA